MKVSLGSMCDIVLSCDYRCVGVAPDSKSAPIWKYKLFFPYENDHTCVEFEAIVDGYVGDSGRAVVMGAFYTTAGVPFVRVYEMHDADSIVAFSRITFVGECLFIHKEEDSYYAIFSFYSGMELDIPNYILCFMPNPSLPARIHFKQIARGALCLVSGTVLESADYLTLPVPNAPEYISVYDKNVPVLLVERLIVVDSVAGHYAGMVGDSSMYEATPEAKPGGIGPNG